jgi:hypothetical protein
MKIDLEPLLDNLEERRYKDRDKSLVVYELVGNGVGIASATIHIIDKLLRY